MILKDFAARKKKQQEEMGSVGGGSVEAFPMVAEASLAPDTDGDARSDRREPTHCKSIVEPPKFVSAPVNVRKEIDTEFKGNTGREALDVVTNGRRLSLDVFYSPSLMSSIVPPHSLVQQMDSLPILGSGVSPHPM